MRAVSIWEIDRVVLSLEGSTLAFSGPADPDCRMSIHGCARSGSVDLTREEARRLRDEIDAALREMEATDRSAEEYMPGDREAGDCLCI